MRGPQPAGRRGACAAVATALLVTVFSASAAGGRRGAEAARPSCNGLGARELAVARAPGLYAVVDGPARQIELKARGIVLRRFPLRGLALVGRVPPPGGPWDLVAKQPLIEPTPRIPPQPGTPPSRDKPAGDAPLTVAAMPARYRLVFEGGLSILVHPGGATGRWQRVLDGLGAAADRVRAWTMVFAGRLAGDPRWALLAELSADEARALYWAVRPPLSVLLRVACPPQGPASGARR